MSVTVLYFARSRELVGRSKQNITIKDIEAQVADSAATAAVAVPSSAEPTSAAVATVRSLVAHLIALHPALKDLLACALLSLNQEFVAMDSTQRLSDGDEVAFIQPISGG